MSIICRFTGTRGAGRRIIPLPLVKHVVGNKMRQWTVYRITLRPDGLSGVVDRATDRVFAVRGDAEVVCKNLRQRTGEPYIVLELKTEEKTK